MNIFIKNIGGKTIRRNEENIDFQNLKKNYTLTSLCADCNVVDCIYRTEKNIACIMKTIEKIPFKERILQMNSANKTEWNENIGDSYSRQ